MTSGPISVAIAENRPNPEIDPKMIDYRENSP